MGNKEEKPSTKIPTHGKTAEKNFAKGAVAKTSENRTERETVYVVEFCKDFNGTRAATVAGYAQPSSRSNELLKKPHIIKQIKEFQKKIAENVIVTKQMITNELALIAFSDYTQLIELVEDAGTKAGPGKFIVPKFKATQILKKEGIGRIIKSIKIGPKGVEFVLFDKLAALEMLGRHIDYFNDTTPPLPGNGAVIYIPDNGRGDTNVQVNVVNNHG